MSRQTRSPPRAAVQEFHLNLMMKKLHMSSRTNMDKKISGFAGTTTPIDQPAHKKVKIDPSAREASNLPAISVLSRLVKDNPTLSGHSKFLMVKATEGAAQESQRSIEPKNLELKRPPSIRIPERPAPKSAFQDFPSPSSESSATIPRRLPPTPHPPGLAPETPTLAITVSNSILPTPRALHYSSNSPNNNTPHPPSSTRMSLNSSRSSLTRSSSMDFPQSAASFSPSVGNKKRHVSIGGSPRTPSLFSPLPPLGSPPAPGEPHGHDYDDIDDLPTTNLQ